jgi:dTDP-4-dehydrorhamnose 3,5-epimerase
LNFTATPIPGAWFVELDRKADERGYFARSWCRDEFAARGLPDVMVQASISHNTARGTLRGMHFQRAPSREAKLVRCQAGRVVDVIVDLRPESPAFCRHHAVELSAASGAALFIPPGVAHGFQTLEPDCDVYYMMSDVYQPELAGGVRHDDPAFGIRWPLPVAVIAPRDAAFPDFVPPRAH